MRQAFFVFLFLLMLSPAFAQKPEIKNHSRLGLRVGRTETLILYGENLTPKEVVVKEPLRVRIVEAKATDEKNKSLGSRQLILEITIPKDCPKENFPLTLTQPDGQKAETPVSVVEDTATEVQIRKPAFTTEKAMEIEGTSVAVLGQLDNDRADFLRFKSKAGDVWEVSVLGGRALSEIDPILRIRNERRVPLAFSAGLRKRDRRIVFRAPAEGIYFVEITDAENRGGGNIRYRITINKR